MSTTHPETGWFAETMSRVATGNLQDRFVGILELARYESGGDAIALAAPRADGESYRPLAAVGYDPEVIDFLCSKEFLVDTEGVSYQLRRRGDSLQDWWDYPGFVESAAVTSVLRPSGFGNGITTPVRSADGRLLAVCHLSVASETFRRDAKAVLGQIRDVLATLVAHRQNTGWDQLTAREHEIVDLIRLGLSNAEIADRLVLSRRTVTTHVENIMRKLNVGNRVAVAVWATEEW